MQREARQEPRNEWREVTFGEIAEIVGGSTPSTRDPNNFDGEIPWLTPKDLASAHNRYVTRGARNLSQMGLERSSAKLLPTGAVLLTTRAPIGYVAIAKNPMATNQGFRNLVLREDCVPEYLYYWLTANTALLESRGSGTTFPELSGSALKEIRLSIPDTQTQRTIAHVLGTLDDKIELNRRMNETLEEMARALFKSWFVDFDPVRAKMEGRWRVGESLPGMPADLYDVFPDRFMPSELGDIPHGWQVRALDSVATFLNGLALQNYPARDSAGLPVIKITQLRAGHTRGADIASADVPEEYRVQDGDVLFSWSGSLELAIWSGGEGALNQHLFKVTSQEYPKWLYYGWIREHLRAFREIAADKATTMGHIQRHHLHESLIVTPDAAALHAIGPYIQSLLDRSLSIRVNATTLAEQRDALLPRLVSGSLRIRSTQVSLGEK